MGGIETPRVLLANDHQQPGGVGNARGLVGRFFQEHPTAVLGSVVTPSPNELQRLFHSFYRRRLKYAPRIALSFEEQQRHRILNASAVFVFDAGADSAYREFKYGVGELLRGRGKLDSVKQMARGAFHAGELVRPVFEFVVRRRGFTPNPRIAVTIFTEQEPSAESRIMLSDAKDALGMRKTRVHWQLTELTLRTIQVFAKTVQAELERLGLGRLDVEEWIATGSPSWKEHVADLYHHMGTTRMSKSPETGVVDPSCRVHGVENLWVASSSVFPTGGHSNPTLTILALAMRLADELKGRI
jgi:choline dehydrogenase-like flavoprotein